ncbi:MAG: dihydrodipicolinate synthase family protein, partial [Lentisphaeria bacterium]|nr:dihydrodipicolinate synthase family protein [Lentisphaeria bacterium]
MKEFKGIIPPAITPLTATRELDIAGLERLIEHMISGGIHGLFVLGTTGEGPAVGYKVQQDMVRESIRIVNNRIPVLVGISSAACQESVEQAQFAFECKANGVVAAPPCYFNLGEPELLDYYKYLAETSKLPLFVYNMPSMTKVYMKPSLVKKLAEIPNIRGYKDSSANMPDF